MSHVAKIVHNPFKGITLRIFFLVVIPFLFSCTTNETRTSDPYGGLAVPLKKNSTQFQESTSKEASAVSDSKAKKIERVEKK